MLTRVETWLLHVATVVVGGSGVVYALMKYLMQPVDEFAVVNHPWQPAVQHLHVVTAPLLVFAAGMIWRRHVLDRWSSTLIARRRSGRSLAVILPAMVLSGYLLQVASAPAWRQLWLVIHLGTSGVWVAIYLVHQLSPRKRPGALPSIRSAAPGT